jgi:hypothetical protein
MKQKRGSEEENRRHDKLMEGHTVSIRRNGGGSRNEDTVEIKKKKTCNRNNKIRITG